MFFPFEMYIGSTNTADYEEDLKKKNSIVKFVNALIFDPADKIALQKFVNQLMYFRNTFCKDAFLYFFLNKFNEDERKLIGRIVYDVFVVSSKGEIGDHKEYYKLCYDLLNDVHYIPLLYENWQDIKAEHEETDSSNL